MKLSVCLTVLANLFLLATGESAMEKLKVVPDIIDNAPKALIEVSYPSGKKVDNGNTLTPTDVHEQPTVKWTADEGKFYTLLLTDPDAPSRKEPKFREWHHWLVGNIPGSAVEKGDVLSQYIGSAPPQGTGKHRYVFLVFQQPGKVSFTEPKLTNKSGSNRGKFNTRNFAKKYQLGDPVAGNVYEAEYDDYVPKIYKQLEGK